MALKLVKPKKARKRNALFCNEVWVHPHNKKPRRLNDAQINRFNLAGLMRMGGIKSKTELLVISREIRQP
jgi:hypothetical protein